MKRVFLIPFYVHVYHVSSTGNLEAHEFMRRTSEQMSTLLNSTSEIIYLFRETSNIRI